MAAKVGNLHRPHPRRCPPSPGGGRRCSPVKMEPLPQDRSAPLGGTSPTLPFFLGAGRALSSPSLTWRPGEEGPGEECPAAPRPPEAQLGPHPLSSAQQLLPGAGSLGRGCVHGTHSRLVPAAQRPPPAAPEPTRPLPWGRGYRAVAGGSSWWQSPGPQDSQASTTAAAPPEKPAKTQRGWFQATSPRATLTPTPGPDVPGAPRPDR